jgi:glycine betaine catabolism B
MPLEPWRTGEVIEIKQVTPNTRSFFIKVHELENFDFKPGQFVTLDLPIHEKPNRRWRSYSIASCPNGTNIFELIIVLLDGGLGTTYLFNEVKIGSVLNFRGAQGVFYLPETIEKDLFLICTGTGIAPFRSMVQDIKNKNIAHKNIHLIFGCRTKEDLLYYDELKNLEKELTNFYYHPTLSREVWDGDKGYVHSIYEKLCSNTQEANFWLCGWKNMIDEAKIKIQALGYDKKSIHQEVYG